MVATEHSVDVLGWFPVVEFAGHVVEAVLYECEVYGVDVEVGSFGEPASEESVGLFVAGSLPRRSRLTEEHLNVEVRFDVGPAGHFCALVPGEGLDQFVGLTPERGGDGCGNVVGAVAVAQWDYQGVAADAFNERGDC